MALDKGQKIKTYDLLKVLQRRIAFQFEIPRWNVFFFLCSSSNLVFSFPFNSTIKPNLVACFQSSK